jgi:penicillin-binding protein 1A
VRRLMIWMGRLVLGCFILGVVGVGAIAFVIHRHGADLPDYQALAGYAPPTVTRIHAGDGRLLAEYARERRVFVPIEAMPEHLTQAFVAAEDQNFYTHAGIDLLGIVRAVVTNIDRLGSDRRPVGASTITQQVAKNFLLSNELSLDRKLKEAILAMRIERAFSKEQILELYLNEIYLGNRSYGVAAASLNYFDKSLDELTIAEAAFIAGLPQAPSRYDPTRNPDAAVARRGYVIGRMLEDGYITAEEAQIAAEAPLELRRRRPEEVIRADFFTEEVRRLLVTRFDEEGFYEGGLSVRTTIDPALQTVADRALRRGLANFDRRSSGWRGPVAELELAEGIDWQTALMAIDPGFELLDWRLAVVLDTDGEGARIGLSDGSEAALPFSEIRWARPRLEGNRLGAAPGSAKDVLTAGDVILVEWLESGEGGYFTLRQRPELEGAIVALNPHTGQVLALSGGFSFQQSWFNRATQARRQPGSAFKPFVYLAALEAGMTPASIIVDAPIAINQGPGLPIWRPENFSQSYYGPSTLRLGIEKSRNLMTVRLAHEIGMQRVVDVAQRFGLEEGLGTNLAGALGSNEVTPLSLATAFAMLVNGGRKIEPYLVERIQDRHGRTVMRRDQRDCPDCMAASWDGGLPPQLPDERELVTDPRLAYQMVSMLQGVVERGTASAARSLGRPLAGKTGTTNDAKDAWFVGFSPDLVAAVFVGYDQPRSLGGRETGSSVALPIWMEFMSAALEGVPRQPFRTPAGLQLVAIDATTGRLAGAGSGAVIREAFLPGTEPTRTSGEGSGSGGNTQPSLGGLY